MKNSRYYRYTEYCLVEIECNDNGQEIKNRILEFTEFADMFEIPLSVVKSWESGRRTPLSWALKLLIEKFLICNLVSGKEKHEK